MQRLFALQMSLTLPASSTTGRKIPNKERLASRAKVFSSFFVLFGKHLYYMGVHFSNAVVFKSVSPPFAVKNNGVPFPVLSGWCCSVLEVTKTIKGIIRICQTLNSCFKQTRASTVGVSTSIMRYKEMHNPSQRSFFPLTAKNKLSGQWYSVIL